MNNKQKKVKKDKIKPGTRVYCIYNPREIGMTRRVEAGMALISWNEYEDSSWIDVRDLKIIRD